MLLRDMLLAREQGKDILLVAPLNSYISKEARDRHIQVYSFEKSFFNRLNFYHKHFSIKKILQQNKIEVIHCYDFNLLFSLSFQLRRYPLISLILTQEHAIDKPLQRFWYRPLISRIDYLILSNKELMQDALGNLGLPPKKIEYFGMGLSTSLVKMSDDVEEKFQLYKEYFLVGTHLSPELESVSSLEPLFYALHVLNEDRAYSQKKTKLILATATELKNFPLLKDLRLKIDELHLSEDVLFVSTPNLEAVIPKVNLWVSNCHTELLEDYSLVALMSDVPIIVGRNLCTMHLLKNYEGVGECYKLSDSRELREAWRKVMLAENVYISKIRLYKYFIEKEHDYKSYKRELRELYMRVHERRMRLFTP